MSESYIGTLDVTTPPGTAFISNADEVMRTIKTACKQTLPNATGAITLTHTQINALPTDITNAQAALKNILDPHAYTTLAGPAAATVVPKGAIIMWAPSAGSIPAGWRLCDGGTYNGLTVPDLRDRFVKCQTTGFAGTRDVAESISTAGAHTHTGNTGSHTLTEAEMPTHRHDVYGSLNGSVANFNIPTANAMAAVANASTGLGFTDTFGSGNLVMETTGGGTGHAHTISSDGGHTHTGILPVHYILAFICYVGA